VVLPLITALVTVALACVALGVWQPASYEVDGLLDAKGNSFSGVFSPGTDEFIGSVHLVFATSEVYEGGFAGNRFNGSGVLSGVETADDGTTNAWQFEGTFVNGRLEGQGSYTDNMGSYTGTFTNSLPNGQGVYSSNSGWRYEGEFQMGMMTGQGTVYLADGTSASGQFEDGLQVSTS